MTTPRRGSSRARSSPSAIVSSSDRVRCVRTGMDGRRQILQQIGGDNRFLAFDRGRELASETVKITRRRNRLLRPLRELAEKSRYKAGEDIANTAGRQGRRTGR